MAVLIYWLGIKGYMQANSPGKGSKLIAQMSPGVVEQTLRSLQSTMETDHLFANPELSLHLLSRHIGIPEKTISAVLNQHIGKSFTDYVNGYRVDAIKQKLHDPQLKRYTIVAVAMQCGFNSKASFQRVFKQHVGVSPNEFRKRTVEATK